VYLSEFSSLSRVNICLNVVVVYGSGAAAAAAAAVLTARAARVHVGAFAG